MAGGRLFVEPDDGVQPVIQFIGRTQRTLDVAMYLLSDHQILTALENAPRRGVKVRVLLEEHPYGTGPGNSAVANRLKGAGLQVAWSPATFRLSHDKYAIADGKIALIGTANWTFSAFRNNREYLVEDSNPTDVGQLAALFIGDWNRTTVDSTGSNLVVSPSNARADFEGLIGTARKSLDLEAEELQDPRIEDALIAAAGRGVEVRVILPLPTSGTDANASGRERLIAGGVQVHRLRSPYVHAKDILVDQTEGFIGSENISTASLDANREVGLVISDPSAIQALESTFNRDWGNSQP